MDQREIHVFIYLGSFVSRFSTDLCNQFIDYSKQPNLFYSEFNLLPVIVNSDPLLHEQLSAELSPILPKEHIILAPETNDFNEEIMEIAPLLHKLKKLAESNKIIVTVFITPSSVFEVIVLQNLVEKLNEQINPIISIIYLHRSRSSSGATSPYYELLCFDIIYQYASAGIILDEDAIIRNLNCHNKLAQIKEAKLIDFQNIINSFLFTLLKSAFNEELTLGNIEEIVLPLKRFNDLKLISVKLINQILSSEKRYPFTEYFPDIIDTGSLSHNNTSTTAPTLAVNIIFTGLSQDLRYFNQIYDNLLNSFYQVDFGNFLVTKFYSNHENAQICILENSTSVINLIESSNKSFHRLYKRKAFLQSLLDKGLSEEKLLKASRSLDLIIKAYLECTENLTKLINFE